jgi:hypothetical protein
MRSGRLVVGLLVVGALVGLSVGLSGCQPNPDVELKNPADVKIIVKMLVEPQPGAPPVEMTETVWPRSFSRLEVQGCVVQEVRVSAAPPAPLLKGVLRRKNPAKWCTSSSKKPVTWELEFIPGTNE